MHFQSLPDTMGSFPPFEVRVSGTEFLFTGATFLVLANSVSARRRNVRCWKGSVIPKAFEKVRNGEGAITSTRGACTPRTLRLCVDFSAALRELGCLLFESNL